MQRIFTKMQNTTAEVQMQKPRNMFTKRKQHILCRDIPQVTPPGLPVKRLQGYFGGWCSHSWWGMGMKGL